MAAYLFDAPLARQQAHRPDVKAGTQAPDFERESLDGSMITLSGLRGKIVLLDFWTAGSGDSVAEIPELAKAHRRMSELAKVHARLRDQGFVIVGVISDSLRGVVDQFLQEHKDVTWPQVAADNKYFEPGNNHVSLRYNNKLLATNGALPVDLNNNQWHHARVTLAHGMLEVFLTPHGRRETRVIKHSIQPWTPYTGRFVIAAHTGGLMDKHTIDNFVAKTTTAGEALGVVAISLNEDFDSGVPAGATLHGSASLVDGAIQLTPLALGVYGSLWFAPPDNSAPAVSWSAEFDFRIGGGTGADGLSLSFSHSGDDRVPGLEGSHSGVAIAFDTFENRQDNKIVVYRLANSRDAVPKQ